MKTSTVYFYAVGLNEQNLAFNKTAFENILAAGKFLDGANERAIILTQPLAFGTPFQISADNYAIFKSATYIKIVNVDTTTETRFGFINNFLELANGNFSVSYTLDDYTNFILYSSEMGVTPHIDGFTERANVPLIKKTTVLGVDLFSFNPNNAALTGDFDNKCTYKRYYKGRYKTKLSGQTLPAGYKCAVYFISTPNYNGNPSGAGQSAQGSILDKNIQDNLSREISRNNSCIYYMVYDNNNESVGIYGKNNENDNYTLIVPRGLSMYDVDDSKIEKIMYFDFIPSGDSVLWSNGFQQLTYDGNLVYGIAVGGVSDNHLKLRLADICYSTNEIYYKALRLKKFTPVLSFQVPSDIMATNKQFNKASVLNDAYYLNSPYNYINEIRKITVKAYTVQIEFNIERFYEDTVFYLSYSGDGETIILKYYSDKDASTTRSNLTTSTGQNINYFDLTQVRDFKSYKNAKITGSAGVAATAVGSVVALGASIASGNVAGMVGALSGGAQGIISGVQKLQGLSPTQQSPANGDFTLTRETNDTLTDYDQDLTFIIESIPPELRLATVRWLEENGALCRISFDEYMQNCQMEAYNAIKCSYMEITGIPQQPARRIADAFVGGVTLWTATDVGNKKVINYPVE